MYIMETLKEQKSYERSENSLRTHTILVCQSSLPNTPFSDRCSGIRAISVDDYSETSQTLAGEVSLYQLLTSMNEFQFLRHVLYIYHFLKL